MYAWNAFGAWVEISQLTTSAGLGIQVGIKALLIQKERVVPRQPLRPQMLFVVNRVLFVKECSFCLQKETDV